MLDTVLNPRNYLRRAVLDQHNVILMVGALLLALAFASPLPLLVGLGAEVLWLAITPRLSSFRGWVDRHDGSARRQRMQAALSVEATKLGAGYRARFERLAHAVDEVVSQAALQGQLSFDELERERAQLERVLRFSLELMRIHQGVVSAVADIPSAELAQEVARLERAFAGQRDLEARMGLRQALLAAQKRLAQREELEQARAKLELELNTIDTSLEYLQTRLGSLIGAGELASQVNAMASDIERAATRGAAVEDALGGAAASSVRPGLSR